MTGEPSWGYREIAGARLPVAASLLDLGTGGGELLATLAPLPDRTVATEGYPPNVAVAQRNLRGTSSRCTPGRPRASRWRSPATGSS